MFIRKAGYDDLEGLLTLYSHLFPQEDYSDKRSFKDKWNEILSSKGLSYFVVVESNVIVASCNISIIPNLTRAQRPYAVIENVITHPDYRRKGYGKGVVQRAVDFAQEENCYKVMLLSTSSREKKRPTSFMRALVSTVIPKEGLLSTCSRVTVFSTV